MSISEILNWRYFTYKGKPYIALRMVKVKAGVEGKWIDGIEYKADYENFDWMGSYVRSYEDFASKFQAKK